MPNAAVVRWSVPQRTWLGYNLSELSGGEDYGSRFCELVTVCNIDLLNPDTLVIELDLNQSDVNYLRIS